MTGAALNDPKGMLVATQNAPAPVGGDVGAGAFPAGFRVIGGTRSATSNLGGGCMRVNSRIVDSPLLPPRGGSV